MSGQTQYSHSICDMHCPPDYEVRSNLETTQHLFQLKMVYKIALIANPLELSEMLPTVQSCHFQIAGELQVKLLQKPPDCLS